MTCIVAVEAEDGTVVIGTDSFIGTDCQKGILDRPKWHTQGCVTMMFAGSIRVPQALASGLEFPDDVPDDVGKMIHDSIPAIREILTANGAMGKDDNMGDTQGSDLVFVCAGKVYVVHADLGVVRYGRGYTAHGAGGDYACGALYSMSKSRRCSERGVMAALQAAEAHSPYVCGPLHVRTV